MLDLFVQLMVYPVNLPLVGFILWNTVAFVLWASLGWYIGADRSNDDAPRSDDPLKELRFTGSEPCSSWGCLLDHGAVKQRYSTPDWRLDCDEKPKSPHQSRGHRYPYSPVVGN